MSSNHDLQQDASKKCVSDVISTAAEELAYDSRPLGARQAPGLPSPALQARQTEPMLEVNGQAAIIPPSPPLGHDVVVGPDDGEAGIQAFDAALALCTEDGSEVPVTALRALFAGAVERAREARARRDSMEDRCNEAAEKHQKAAEELARARAEAAKAKVSKLTLEISCREHASMHLAAVGKAKAAKAEEELHVAELREKFDVAVPDIQEKLEVEAARRRKQREDNKGLRDKLVDFVKQTEENKERFAENLKTGSLKIQIAQAKCDQQEAERRVSDGRTEDLRVQLQNARAYHVKDKAAATERERCLSKIQATLNERKKLAAALKAKTKELLVAKASLEAERPILREAAASEEAATSLTKVVERLQGLCSELERDVEAKRVELARLQQQS